MPRKEISKFTLQLAKEPIVNLSIRQLRVWTKNPDNLLGISQHLRKEVPIRFAKRVVELEQVHPKLREHPFVEKVQNTYTEVLDSLHSVNQPQTLDDVNGFAQQMEGYLNGRNLIDTIEKLCLAVQELKPDLSSQELQVVRRDSLEDSVGVLGRWSVDARLPGGMRPSLAGDTNCRLKASPN